MNRLLRLSLALAAVIFGFARPASAATGLKDLSLLGTNHLLSGATFAVDSGATLDASAGTLTLASGQVAWVSVSKSGASLADLPTRLWSSLQSTPTTLAGYGITDAITAAAVASGYQPLDSDLTSIAALATTSFGRGLLTESSATTLKSTLSLGNVDNTSDAAKPVSTATQTALNLKANLASPTFTGTPAAPTPAVDTSTTQLATTAFVLAQAASATPLIDGTATVGTSTRYARADHVHPTDTSRAPLVSPAFTGTPTAPTAAAGTNTTQLATTAFVETRALVGSGQRRTDDCFLSDGATNSRAVVHPLPFSLAGQACVFRVKFLVPTSNPSAVVFPLALSSSATSSPDIVAYGFSLRFATDGTLQIWQRGATAASDYRGLVNYPLRSTYSGQTVDLFIRFTVGDSTTNPTIRCNGVDISSSFAVTTGGTPPNWMPSTLVSTYLLTGYNAPAGKFWVFPPVLGTMTDAECDTATTTGLWPDWWYAGTGNPVNRITGDSYNFAGGNGNWSGTATSTADAANAELDVTTSATNQYVGSSNSAGTIVVGRKYRFVVTLRNIILAGGATLRIQVGGGLANNILVSSLSTDGTYAVDFVASGPGTGILVLQLGGTSSAFSIYQPTLTDLGPIFEPVVQPIPVVDDARSNHITGYLTAGITPITARRAWRIVAQTATNGNQQLLGAAVFFNSSTQRIDSWVINNAGSSETVSLGSASAGTQYLSSGTVASGLYDVTLVTRFNGSTALWCNASGTATLTHILTGHVVY